MLHVVDGRVKEVFCTALAIGYCLQMVGTTHDKTDECIESVIGEEGIPKDVMEQDAVDDM